MSTDIGSYVHFEIFLLYYPSHTHANGILYACLVVCLLACEKKLTMNLKKSGQYTWEGLERRNGREECCNYIIISTIKNIKKK